jgi:hypothetical protein
MMLAISIVCLAFMAGNYAYYEPPKGDKTAIAAKWLGFALIIVPLAYLVTLAIAPYFG